MAHFCELNSNNVVIRTLIVHNNELLDKNGYEREENGVKFLKKIYGDNTVWVQTSYNNSFRRKFATSGWSYNYEKDVFVEPQPFPSWSLNLETLIWEPPIPMPEFTDDTFYWWSETNMKWMAVYEPGWRQPPPPSN